MAPSGPRSRAVAVDQLRAATGSLSTTAIARIEADRPWFRELSAQDRSWVGMIVQAGVRGFVDWFADGGAEPGGQQVAIQVFGAAPRDLAGVIDLHQTVDLIKLTIDEVEANVDRLIDAEVAADVHAAVLRYGREVAFATAEVYARAAEVRGRWDARLEALVVDAVRRAARGRHLDALCAVQGHLLVVILGGVDQPEKDAAAVVGLFGEGPVVIGPVALDLGHAHISATIALGALRAAAGWPDAPRPVSAHDLLPERILAGDPAARADAVDLIHRPLAESRGELVETLVTYFAHASGIEATARALFVHANTVRYRLGQIADLTGLTPSQPRDALTLQLALILGRQAGGLRPAL